jgi:hypothetical protein
MNHVSSIAARIGWLPVTLATAECIALVLVWLWVWKRRERTPTAAQFVLIVLTARFVLFATPLSWFAYYATIGSDFIDSRERDIVAAKVKTFLAPPPGQEFLAVGSSQTRAVYTQYSKKNPILGYYVLAAMQPIDYVDEYGEILKSRPKVILLYISEFDLGRPVDLSTCRLSDLRLAQWPAFYKLIAQAAGPKAAWDTMAGIAIADLFPENKYSFIFADYLKEVRARFAGSPPDTPTIAQETHREITTLRKLTAETVPRQALFLEEFLRLTERDGIPVVLVEGQYNPHAYTAKNVALNRDVLEPALERMQLGFSNLAVVRRASIRQFAANDYRDGYHVKPDAGDHFVTQLLDLLRRQQTVSLLKRRI